MLPRNSNNFDNIEDDYFDPQSSFKNRDIYANFGGDLDNTSENYGGKQIDDLNLTHQSLMSTKDDRKLHQNRINNDAL